MAIGDYVWLIVVGVPVCCWWLYYGWAAWLTVRRTPPVVPVRLPDTAVIIAARNEASNLRKFLPQLLQQSYPGIWAVWVVNDHSSDDTQQVLAALQQEHPHLHVLNLPHGVSGKKAAVQAGIEACSAACIIITDADCYPASHDWLGLMVQPMTTGFDAVVGFSPCERGASGLLVAFQQYEYAMMALLYLSAAILRKPYMAVGRNMGFTKAVYDACGGMDALPEMLSGSDDLLLQRIAAVGTVEAVPAANAWMYTTPQLSRRAWWHQKSRHVSTGKMYTALGKWWLGGWMFGLVLYYLWLLYIGFQIGWWIVIVVHIVRTAMQIGIFEQWSGKQNRLVHYFQVPFLDILLAIYVICGLPLLQWKAVRTWK